MGIANRWADGEDFLHNSRSRSYDEDDADARHPIDSGRKRDRNSDRQRKRKHRGYEEADGAEMVAVGFTDQRDGENRTDGNCNSGYRSGGYHDGGGYRKKDREWQPRRTRDDGPSALQQLSGSCTIHFYTDDEGKRKSSHLLKDCRHFQKLQEAYA